MALATASRPAVHGLSGRRSPTLSDAGMILPDHSHVRSDSSNLLSERPPSPPALYTHTNSSRVKLASVPPARRCASQLTKSPALSYQSSRSTLRTMDAAGAGVRDGTLALSPTIQNDLSSPSPSTWTPRDLRRASDASSLHSEDFENWPGFDSHDAFDDSGLGLEDQERRDHLPGDAKKTKNGMQGDGWLRRGSDGSDESDNPYSSAALSRRAEIILANAKKRLNVMEGNLRGARESLVVPPTTRNSSELSLHINSTRDRDRRLYAGLGPIPPRIPIRSSGLSPNSSPGHSRGLSETSVPLPFSSPSYLTRSTSNKRASSAIGHTSGPWSPEGFGQGRFPIKEARSLEVIRDPRAMAMASSTEQQYPIRTTSRNSRSPPALETLQEDEDVDGRQVHRSSSAASGLRDQMNDLKGRISSLKLRAQEDQLRRRSQQSLRGSSPFTNAQEWYSGPDAYHAEGAPVSENVGLGIKTDSLTRHALFEEEEHSRPRTTETTASQREGEKLVNYDNETPSSLGNGHSSPLRYNGMDQDFDDLESYDDEQDFDDIDEAEFLSVNGDALEQDAETIYEDAVYEMPATARHEDRVDAFDYEHFFLHSTMGTYSLEGRRASLGSNSSTATTRPVTAVQVQEDEDLSTAEKRVSYHGRNPSSTSVSTVASFATAAENQSDDEEENEQMDHFSEQILAQHQPTASRSLASTSHASLRADSAINMRRGLTSSPSQAAIARSSVSPANLASGLQISKIFSILTDASSPSSEEPRLALSEEEKQLIYSLASSFQQVCSNLHHTDGDQYERKAWRRRLDEARRVLDGDDGEDDDSF